MSKDEFFEELRVSFVEMREMQDGRMEPLDADTVMADLRKESEIASHPPIIDEESEDYHAFLVKMAQEAMQEESFYLPMDELHKLFE